MNIKDQYKTNRQTKKPNFVLKLIRYKLGEKTEPSWEAISLGESNFSLKQGSKDNAKGKDERKK